VVLYCLPGTLTAADNSKSTYLALGDSVAYGLDVTLLLPPPAPPPPPSAFTGYPEILASTLHFGKEINTSCPGETSGSFIKGAPPDLGCYGPGPQGQPPFKASIGLHTNYSGAQLDFAVSQLLSNKGIDLVTLAIGSNDALLAIAGCSTAPNPQVCVFSHLPQVLQTYAANLTHILTAIRRTARYKDDLVLVGYYAPSADLIPVAIALNTVTVAVSLPFDVTYADGFTAFQLAAAGFGGDVCRAGLLVHLSPTTCDIHPSPKGRDLLAATVANALSRHH
jgi:lysophospholipase L1-like esterase